MYYAVLLSQEVEQHHGAYHVRKHGRDGYSIDVHSQSQNKEDVGRHIEDPAYSQADERSPRVAVAPEDGGLKIVEHYKRHTAEVNAEVCD